METDQSRLGKLTMAGCLLLSVALVARVFGPDGYMWFTFPWFWRSVIPLGGVCFAVFLLLSWVVRRLLVERLPSAFSPKFTAVMVMNVIGVVVYLGLASRCWIEPELADVPGASGGAFFFWGLAAFPVCAVFIVLDLLWALFGCMHYLLTRKTWMLHPAFMLVPVMWAVAWYVDISRHGQ